MSLLIGDLLALPEVNQNLPKVQIDLKTIKAAENRIDEVAIVNKDTAPELLAAFNKAYLQVTEAIASVTLQYSYTEREVAKRRAVILLDEAKDILTKKGLTNPKSPTGSEDLRNAVIESDEQFLALSDKLDFLKAVLVLLDGKRRAFEQAFTGVRKLLDNRDVGGYVHQTVDQNVQVSVGRARY